MRQYRKHSLRTTSKHTIAKFKHHHEGDAVSSSGFAYQVAWTQRIFNRSPRLGASGFQQKAQPFGPQLNRDQNRRTYCCLCAPPGALILNGVKNRATYRQKRSHPAPPIPTTLKRQFSNEILVLTCPPRIATTRFSQPLLMIFQTR